MLGMTVSAAIGFGAFFTIELLRLRNNYKRLYQCLYILAIIASTNALAAFFIPYHGSVLVSLVASLTGCCLGLTAGLLSWRRGYPPARYYTLAWACFLIGTCIFAFNKFGVLPANLFTENAMQLGSALEVVLLSFALANRINVAQQEKGQAERDREIAEQSARAKNQFLATMSHEIRTPLNGVLGMTDLLLTTSLTVKQRHYADTVRRSGKHLIGIINDILDLAKIEAGKLELEETPFDLRLLLNDLAELFAERAQRKGLELVCSIPPTLSATFYGDAPRLNQILINLVGNAVKFTQQGQVIIRLVSVKAVDGDTDTGTHSQAMVHLAIEDSGPGIEPAQQGQVFGSFFQADNTPISRRHEGSGLGLAIAKQLVELMGGRIGLESVPGQGSTFWFTVCLEQRPATSPVLAEMPSKNVHLANKNLEGRVLIVEDNPVNAEIADTILESFGCQTRSVEDGYRALDILAQQNFDLILMDCHMPKLDGYATTIAIRQREMTSGQHTPIVALTANAMASERAHCLEIGMDDYLSKPFTPEQLYDLLQQWLPRQTDRESPLEMAVPIHPSSHP
jgi:signal transduction histidine kinase/CheY-like chemotaxis protein